MDLLVAALLISLGIIAAGAILRPANGSPRSPATRAVKSADPSPVPGSFEERLERVERALPAYQLEMEAISENARDLLHQAGRRLARVQQQERRLDEKSQETPEEGRQRMRVVKTGSVIEPL